jgi:hypothetical protein
MEWSVVIGLLAIYGPMVAFAAMFTFFPEQVVRLLARLLKHNYKGFLHMPDDQLARMPFSSYDKYGKESLRNLVNRGAEHPEEFPSLIQQLRRSGCIVWIFVSIGLGGFILWAMPNIR